MSDMTDKTQLEKINERIKQGAELGFFETNQISDGYHTFKELYDHRIALFIALCSQLDAAAEEFGKEKIVWKSRKHSDGTSWDGWFIMGIFKEKGKQITYHLPEIAWEYTTWVTEIENAPEWDGHTPEDVIDRLTKL